jgi:hypothetical protein
MDRLSLSSAPVDGDATKTFDPELSRRDPIFSGLFERHHRLTLAIVEFEPAPNRFKRGAAPALGEGLQLP